jgi:hypothetical protein
MITEGLKGRDSSSLSIIAYPEVRQFEPNTQRLRIELFGGSRLYLFH